MTIKQLINSEKVTTNVAEIQTYSCVNIGFMNNEDKEDETQLMVEHHLLKEAGTNELDCLFRSLCPELDTKPNNVTYIEVVASASTHAKLIAMGY